jgi:hypothetical protein
VAQSECIISGCTRAAQISGLLKGYCCSLCGVTDPARHAIICNMIEETGNAEVQLGSNIILGYN